MESCARIHPRSERIIDETFELLSSWSWSLCASCYNSKMFELRKTEHCGFGLFAIENIPVGTLLLREKPLLSKHSIFNYISIITIDIKLRNLS